VKLAKAHGLGNDFLLVEESSCPSDASRWARRLCDRHAGVGADGVVVYGVGAGSARMRLINADGSDAEISGNGLRCLAGYLVHTGLASAAHVVATAAGPRAVWVEPAGGTRFRVTADLGSPILDSRCIPVALEPPAACVVDHVLDVAGRSVAVTATSLGNPHCAVFSERPPLDDELARLGAALETHPFFPRRTNVEFVAVAGPGELCVRFWERGVGYTRASGTGAASAVVASVLAGRSGRTVRVVCDGGVLEVDWPEGGTVRQVGDVEVVFEGEWVAR